MSNCKYPLGDKIHMWKFIYTFKVTLTILNQSGSITFCVFLSLNEVSLVI